MRYSNGHAWVRPEGGGAVVGITPHAVSSLGELQYVSLPKVGKTVTAGGPLAVVESSKAASDVPAPVSGTVTAVNPRLARDPALVNREPTGDGWLVQLKDVDLADFDALLDETAYGELIGGR